MATIEKTALEKAEDALRECVSADDGLYSLGCQAVSGFSTNEETVQCIAKADAIVERVSAALARIKSERDNARADGYAEGRADERADVVARLKSHGAIYLELLHETSAGAHVGAADRRRRPSMGSKVTNHQRVKAVLHVKNAVVDALGRHLDISEEDLVYDTIEALIKFLVTNTPESKEWMIRKECPQFDDSRGALAMAYLLEIDEEDADYLFLPGDSGLDDTASAHEVADHIETFVRGRWSEHSAAQVTR